MSIAVESARTPTGAGAGFYALVTDVRTGLFSKNVSCLFVDVLSGTVERGDQVELLRPDGSVRGVVARELRESLGQAVLDLADPHPTKSDLGTVTIARTPGLLTPPLPRERAADVERLLGSVRATRALGFPVEQAQPIKPVAGLTPEQLCALLVGLPDEAVVLLVQKRIRVALGKHGNPFEIIPDAERAAMHLAMIGLPEDGDRLLLAAAAIVQGHKAGVALRAGASAGAMGVLASENVVGSALDLGKRVGWAIGIEMGDAFAKGFESSVKAGGEAIEKLLLEAGRAVGVGWCKGCHDVVQLRLGRSGLTGWPELRCPADNKKADEPVLIVPADALAVQQALRSAGR
jgi:hypothetical protein